jgi:hypothetical protein
MLQPLWKKDQRAGDSKEEDTESLLPNEETSQYPKDRNTWTLGKTLALAASYCLVASAAAWLGISWRRDPAGLCTSLTSRYCKVSLTAVYSHIRSDFQ